MIKGQVLNSLKDTLDEWLLGFNSDQDFNVSLFSSEKVNLKNALINPDRVNKELADQNSPFRFKAGIIGNLSVYVSANARCRDISYSSWVPRPKHSLLIYFTFCIIDEHPEPVQRVRQDRAVRHPHHSGRVDGPHLQDERLFE